MSAHYRPDTTQSSNGGLADKLVKLSPKAPPNSWWALAVLFAVVIFRQLVLPAHLTGAILQFLLASGLAALWCIRNWRGWLSVSMVAAICFIILIPNGYLDLLLILAAGFGGWMLTSRLAAAQAAERAAAEEDNGVTGPHFPGYGIQIPTRDGDST